MATVIAERQFEQPQNVEQTRAIVTGEGQTLERLGVRTLRHYIAADELRAVSVFDAPDIHAVLDTLQPCRVWPATLHLIGSHDLEMSDGRAQSVVVVERSLAAPATFDQLQALEDAGRGCFEMRNVKPVMSYFSFDRLRLLCIYAAPDAESVRRSNRLAEMPFDRAWTAAVFAAGETDELSGR
jgi:Nickel responsive protein SCO4226-like